MKDKIDIEKLFSEKFESFSAKPDPSVFQGIENGLNASSGASGAAASTGLSLKAKIAAIVASSLVAGGTIGYFISQSNQDKDQQKNPKKEVVNTPISENSEEQVQITTDPSTSDTIKIKEGKVYETKKVSEERVKEYLGEDNIDDAQEIANQNNTEHQPITKIEKNSNNGISDHNSSSNHTNDIAIPEFNDENTASDDQGTTTPDREENVEITLNPVANPSIGHAPLEIEFFAKSKNADVYEWSFGDDRYSEEQNPIHTFNHPGEYSVELTAARLVNGEVENVTTKTIIVTVQPKSKINKLPNIITPNGDGANDYFKISSEGIESIEIMVFDQRGKVVYQARGDADLKWNGTDLYGSPLEGNFMYSVKAVGKDGSVFTEKQSLQIKRSR